MHEKQRNITKPRVPMIRYGSSKQLTLAEFDWPFQTTMTADQTLKGNILEDQTI